MEAIAKTMEDMAAQLRQLNLGQESMRQVVSTVEKKQDGIEALLQDHERQISQLRAMVKDAELNRASAEDLEAATEVPRKRQRSQEKYRFSTEAGLENEPATEKRVVELINEALYNVVEPTVAQELEKVHSRIERVEAAVRSLTIRINYVERDTRVLQTDMAKRQVVVRGWPADSDAEDRKRVISWLLGEAFKEHPEYVHSTTVSTPTYETDDGKRVSGPVTIVTFLSFENRRLFTERHGKAVKYWRDGFKGRDMLKINPGITPIQRRMESPLHNLMNVYNAAFPTAKGVSLKPKWNTLTLLTQGDQWLGRVCYHRIPTEERSTADTTLFRFVIQYPQEMEAKLLPAWVQYWNDKKKKQVELSDAEEQAAVDTSEKAKTHWTRNLYTDRPQWDEGAAAGVDSWVARFKWEFPWPVMFQGLPQNHPERSAFVAVKTMEEIVKELEGENSVMDFTADKAGSTQASAAAAASSTGAGVAAHVAV